MIHLGVNIDHAATLRQARYAKMPDSPNAEPVLLEIAQQVVKAGAHSITVHLRADRRHIQDADVWMVREKVKTMLNLEMGNTPEIIEIALKVKPDFICLVPENRQEITTEGGLDVLAHMESLTAATARLKITGAEVSFFVDPIMDHIRAAADCGADTVELHTGTFANHTGDERKAEVERLVNAACLADTLGLQVNAGHGLTTKNLPDLFEVPHLDELNIGHHLMSRGLSVGVTAAVKEMLKVMKEYPG